MTSEEYDERKRFLEDLKLLSKTEHEKIFEIIHKERAEFTENSNGVFFDVCKLSPQVFKEIQVYMKFCSAIRNEQTERDMEEQKAQENLRY
jgi:hypothetical protein